MPGNADILTALKVDTSSIVHSKIKYSYLCRRCSGFWSYQVCYSRSVINLGSNKKSVQMDIFL